MKNTKSKRLTRTANGGSLKRVVLPLAWKWAGHLSGNRCVTAYRCELYKAQCEKWCNRREGNGPGGYEYYGGGTSFFLDGDKREYKTQKQLIAAIEKRQNPKLSDPKMKTHKRSTRSRTTKAARSGSLKRVVRRRPQPPYCPSCGILNYHCNCDNFQVRHDND